MSKFDGDDELNWKFNDYQNAACYTCEYKDRDGINSLSGAAKNFCSKYPISRYSIGVHGKPIEVLNGTKSCPYYKKVGKGD